MAMTDQELDDFITANTSSVIKLFTNGRMRTVLREIVEDYRAISVSGGGVGLGETSGTAYRGDRGKTAYDHTLLVNNPHSVTKTQIGLGSVDNTADTAKP